VICRSTAQHHQLIERGFAGGEAGRFHPLLSLVTVSIRAFEKRNFPLPFVGELLFSSNVYGI